MPFELSEKVLDTPLNELTCEMCKRSNRPAWQVRLSAAECGQSVAHIGWQCSLCGWKYNFTPDDLDILGAKTLE